MLERRHYKAASSASLLLCTSFLTSNLTHWGSLHVLPSLGERHPWSSSLWAQVELSGLCWGALETATDQLLTQTTDPGKPAGPSLLWLETPDSKSASAKYACIHAPEAERGQRLHLSQDSCQLPGWRTRCGLRRQRLQGRGWLKFLDPAASLSTRALPLRAWGSGGAAAMHSNATCWLAFSIAKKRDAASGPESLRGRT